MGALKKAAAGLAAFGRMARRAVAPAPVELPAELFPVGRSGAWGELMAEMGVKAIGFKERQWKDESMAGRKYVITERRGVFELENGESSEFELRGEMAWLGAWAMRTGLRLEAGEAGPRWVAPSKSAAGKTRWANALEEENLDAAAAAAREECQFSSALAGRCERLRIEKLMRENPEQVEKFKARMARGMRFRG